MKETWYLRKSDGAIYGPVPLDELAFWAADGRVEPEDFLSPDQKNWTLAREVPELGMTCVIRFPTGEEYGPIHRLMLTELILDGDVPADTPVHDVSAGTDSIAAKVALRAVLQKPSAEADLRNQLEMVKQDHALVIQDATAMQTRLEARIAELEQGDSELRNRISEMEKMAAEREDARGENAQQVERLQKELKILESELKKERERAAELDQAGGELRNRIAEMEKMASKKDDVGDHNAQQVKRLQKELKALEADLNKERERAADLVSIKRVEECDAKWRKQLDEKESEWTEMREQHNREVTTLREEVKQLTKELAALPTPSDQPDMSEEVATVEDQWRTQLAEKEKVWDSERAALQKRLEALQSQLTAKAASVTRTVPETNSSPVQDSAGSSDMNPVVWAALSRLRSQAIQGSPELSPESRARRAALTQQNRVKPPKAKKRRRMPVAMRTKQHRTGA